jgi:hypothetical protein
MRYRQALFAAAAIATLGLAACESDNVAPAAASTQTGIDNSGRTNSPGTPSPGATGSDTTARQAEKPSSTPEAPPVRPGGP